MTSTIYFDGPQNPILYPFSIKLVDWNRRSLFSSLEPFSRPLHLGVLPTRYPSRSLSEMEFVGKTNDVSSTDLHRISLKVSTKLKSPTDGSVDQPLWHRCRHCRLTDPTLTPYSFVVVLPTWHFPLRTHVVPLSVPSPYYKDDYKAK